MFLMFTLLICIVEKLLIEFRYITENQVVISLFFYLNDIFFQANVHSPTSVVPAGTCWSLLFC